MANVTPHTGRPDLTVVLRQAMQAYRDGLGQWSLLVSIFLRGIYPLGKFNCQPVGRDRPGRVGGPGQAG
jgi:hypothetical protein